MTKGIAIFVVLLATGVWVMRPVSLGPAPSDNNAQTLWYLHEYFAVISLVAEDQGAYPDTDNLFENLFRNVLNSEGWSGPYLREEKPIVDAWGRPMIYRSPPKCERHRSVDFYSVGENGIDECGAGDDLTLDMAAPLLEDKR